METRSQKRQKLDDRQQIRRKMFSDTSTQLRSGRAVPNELQPGKRKSTKASKNIAQTLTPVPLKIIFKSLPIDDLINCQHICTHWTQVIKDSEVWKNKIWTLRDCDRQDNAYKFQLVNGPLIKNIVIPTKNMWFNRELDEKLCKENSEVLETVLLHQQDLLSLKVYKFPVHLIHKIVAKFPNLEKVHLGVAKSNALEVLTALDSCKNLQELQFIFAQDRDGAHTPFRTYHVNKITQLLSHSFYSLTSLDISYFQNFLSPEYITDILKKKINQLKKLTFTYSRDTSFEDLEIISQFPNLELDLCIQSQFDLSILKNMKVVNMGISASDIKLFVAADIRMRDVEGLDITQYVCHPETDFVSSINVTFPNLRCLRIQLLTRIELNDEFIHLAELRHLRAISLVRAYAVNTVGFSNLSKCPALESLAVSCARMDDHSLHAISQCSTLRHLQLKNCIWRTTLTNVLSMISSLQKLQSLKLIQPDRKYKLGIHLSIPVIKAKCISRRIRLETEDWLEMNL